MKGHRYVKKGKVYRDIQLAPGKWMGSVKPAKKIKGTDYDPDEDMSWQKLMEIEDVRPRGMKP